MIDKKIYYHNGSEYVEIASETITDGFTFTELIDDTLDTGTLIIRKGIENYLELWTSIKIECGIWSKCFLVADINTVRNKTIQEQYTHTLFLIEPTKYLEKVFCQSMSFTKKNKTLLQQLQRAINNAEVLRYTQDSRFVISDALSDRIRNEPSRDFFFERSTLREIIDGILGVLDLRVEVYEITDFNNITLDCYDVNAKNNRIELGEIVNKSFVENIEYLGSDIEAYGENSFSGSRSAIYHPSPNGWDTFKTNEATLTSENAVMSTTFPIEEIRGCIIKSNHTVRFGDGSTSIEVDFENVDISRNVIDIETYNILSSGIGEERVYTDLLYKENVVYFTRGQEQLVAAEVHTYNLFFRSTNLQTAIYNAIYNSIEVQAWLTDHPDYGVNDIYNAPGTFDNTIFRIKYIPYIDAHTRIDKANYSKVPSTMIDNQSDKTIDLERYGDNLSSTINRLGNKMLIIDKIHQSINDVWQVQDYTTDNYVITKKTVSLYNQHIKANYEFTKDFSSINERIGIDRARRIYNIPLENFIRDVLIKEYMVASFNGPTENTGATSLFMRVFYSSFEKLVITNAVVQTVFSGGSSDWLELSVVPYAMANSLHFRFKFVDNYSAGMSITNQVIGGKKTIPNSYVNDLGEHYLIRIILLNDKAATRSEDYDDVKFLPKTTLSWYDNTLKLIDERYKIDKDAYEFMQYVYQLEIISNDPNIIVGKAIAKLHPMVSDANYSLRIFTSDTEVYKSGETKAKGSVNTTIAINYEGNLLVLLSEEYPHDPVILPNVKSWCIADAGGNILVAVNKVGDEIINNSVRFNHKTSRD